MELGAHKILYMLNQGASLEFLWMSDEDSLFEILEILYSYLVFSLSFLKPVMKF